MSDDTFSAGGTQIDIRSIVQAHDSMIRAQCTRLHDDILYKTKTALTERFSARVSREREKAKRYALWLVFLTPLAMVGLWHIMSAEL